MLSKGDSIVEKVLQICSSLTYGGTESYIMNIYRNIDRQKIQFHFLCFLRLPDSYEEEIRKMGGEVFYLFSPGILKIFDFIKHLKKIVKDNGPYAAMHVHVDNLNGILVFAGKFAKIPVRIAHAHSAFDRKGQNTFRNIYEEIKKYLVNKFSTKKLACSIEAAKSVYGVKKIKDVKIIENGIDVLKFQNIDITEIEELRKKLNISSNDFVIGNISRFDNNKNQIFIVDIFEKLLQIKKNSILVLGGTEGEEKKKIIEKIRRNGLEEKVRILGIRKDINIILHMFDYYIFPSKSEGLGIALLEAQAAGIPVIASNTIPQLVDLNLGLIKFESINIGPEKWASYIANSNKHEVNYNLIQTRFEERGFDIRKSVKQIEKMYLET